MKAMRPPGPGEMLLAGDVAVARDVVAHLAQVRSGQDQRGAHFTRNVVGEIGDQDVEAVEVFARQPPAGAVVIDVPGLRASLPRGRDVQIGVVVDVGRTEQRGKDGLHARQL